MTGADVEIICGEWEIGDIPPDESGEEYNVVLTISRITRHPNFEINQGVLRTNFLHDDIAVISVKVSLYIDITF